MNDERRKAVIVRTYSAGVHFGYLVRKEGKEVELTKSRRIHYWYGANSISGIAAHGLDVKKSRVADRVNIVLTEAIEIVECSDEAVTSLENAVWVV